MFYGIFWSKRLRFCGMISWILSCYGFSDDECILIQIFRNACLETRCWNFYGNDFF